MLDFLAILIGSLLAVLLVLALILLYVYSKFKRTARDLGYNNLSEIKKMIRESEEEAKIREKSVAGMTNILLPQIRKDYQDFNENEFYSKVETSLLAIFNSLTKEEVSKSDELNLIRDQIQELVDNNKNNEIIEEYTDIKFHKHALKGYQKINGCLTITVGSSVEYYYKKSIKGKVKEEFEEFKKQTSYITKYVHIYDPEVYKTTTYSLSAHCPNCGAVLKNYADNHCDFCGSGIEPINLKSWFISDYKEDER